jgi:hypothetical protein
MIGSYGAEKQGSYKNGKIQVIIVVVSTVQK